MLSMRKNKSNDNRNNLAMDKESDAVEGRVYMESARLNPKDARGTISLGVDFCNSSNLVSLLISCEFNCLPQWCGKTRVETARREKMRSARAR